MFKCILQSYEIYGIGDTRKPERWESVKLIPFVPSYTERISVREVTLYELGDLTSVLIAKTLVIINAILKSVNRPFGNIIPCQDVLFDFHITFI